MRPQTPQSPGPGAAHDKQLRILVLAPTANDARLTVSFLEKESIVAEPCRNMPELCAEMRKGCGAAFIAEEALSNGSIEELAGALSGQPSWSDLPIAVITSESDPSLTRFHKLRKLDPGCNVTILERPFRPETLVRNAEVALRSRQRQYQVRDLLDEGRKREDILRASEERFRRMSDSAPVMIWLAGLYKECFWFNRAWLDFTGRSLSEEIGDGWMDNVHPDDFDTCLQTYTNSFDSRTPFQMEYRLRRHDGQWRWLLSHGVPLYGAEGELNGFIGSCVDITERKETLSELEKLVDERTATLKETIGDLEAFSYTVSHDLRAPLRAVQSYAQILKNEYTGAVLDDTGIDYLNRIVNAGNRLDGLIQDVLAYSRVARRDYPLHPVDIDKLVTDIIRQYPQLNAPEIDVSIHAPLHSVQGSEALLTQCLSNLLSNAVKFLPSDRTPKIVIRSEKTDETRVRIWIEDNGIGIDPEHQKRIYGMFERLHQKGYEGTGVGLAIVRKAAERMGGTTGVISEPGEGSKFWIELERA